MPNSYLDMPMLWHSEGWTDYRGQWHKGPRPPSRFGVTPEGFVQKRLDVILEELHDDLSRDLDINTRLNPKSRLNVLMTNFADRIAEVWEVAGEEYFAMYPSSAEDMSLDYAAEFGGSVRKDDARTYYPITCYGKDGTELPVGTRISSDTTPATEFTLLSPGLISLSSCNRFKARRTGQLIQADAYTISINGKVYFPPAGTSANDTAILNALRNAINADRPNSAVVADGLLVVDAGDHRNSMSVVLSSTLTTEEVSSTVVFATSEYGDAVLPNGAITRIVSSPPGLFRVDNQVSRIAGESRETDEELRLSYAEKIFIRSRTMLESIDSAILTVQGVESSKTGQNDTHLYVENMPPNSVESVVAGSFDESAVAKAILSSKAGGIRSCHCCGWQKVRYTEPKFDFDNAPYLRFAQYAVEVVVPGENDEPITVRFTRPIDYPCDIRVEVSLSNDPLAVNAFDLIERTIREEMAKLKPGGKVIPQEWLANLYKTVSGIGYFGITVNADGHENAKFITGVGYNYLPACRTVDVVEAVIGP
jgi:hypothetical protein